MIDSDIPPAVVRAVVKSRGIVDIKKRDAGLSGGMVAHCRSADGQEYALKRWPNAIPLNRIESIHRVVIHAWNQGCTTVARPLSVHPLTNEIRLSSSDTVLSAAGENWELAQWRPGVAATTDAGLDAIRLGGELIGQFHQATAALESHCQRAPIIQERLRVLASHQQHLPAAMQWIQQSGRDGNLAASLRDAASLIHWKWDEAQDKIHRSLLQDSDNSVTTQYVLRDVHAQHILFSSGRVTGLIDFDAVRIDTPASDLARWAGSFLSGQHSAGDIWEATFEGYRSTCELTGNGDEQQLVRMAKNLCFAGTWLSLANWLVWLLVERRDFEAPPGILAERIYNLIRVATAHD